MGFFKKLFGGSPPPAAMASEPPPPPGEPAQMGGWDAVGVVSGPTAFDRAIDEVLASFDLVLAAAVAASQPLIAGIPTTFAQLSQAWSAIEHQQRRHADEISERWDQYLEHQSEIEAPLDDDDDDEHDFASPHHAFLDAEGKKCDAGAVELEVRHQRAYRQTMAIAAERLGQWAFSQPAPTSHCPGCGMAVATQPIAHQVQVACGGCQQPLVLEPGDARRMFAASGAPALAEWAAHEAWAAMKRAEVKIQSYRRPREVPLPLLEAFDAAARSYHQTRFEVEARHVPELAAHVPAKIEGQLHATLKLLRQHPQWKAHAAAQSNV